jgi:hypothetical protein
MHSMTMLRNSLCCDNDLSLCLAGDPRHTCANSRSVNDRSMPVYVTAIPHITLATREVPEGRMEVTGASTPPPSALTVRLAHSFRHPELLGSRARQAGCPGMPCGETLRFRVPPEAERASDGLMDRRSKAGSAASARGRSGSDPAAVARRPSATASPSGSPCTRGAAPRGRHP